MNTNLAEILKGYIETLPFADKVGGLVKTVSVKNTNGGVDKYPVGCNVTHQDCLSGKYKDLMPNSNYKSVMYFEDLQPIKLIDADRSCVEYESNLRLVGWLNMNKLGVQDCSISAMVISDVMNSLPMNHFNSGDFTRIKITMISEEIKDNKIFSNYTYSETCSQYLMNPYDYFAVNFKITYRVPKECSTSLLLGTEINC